jgi:heme/copper-type cytochrome/quinol oxidase subunit 3
MSGEPTVSDITPPDLTDKPLFTETPEEREFELRAAVGAYWSGGRLLIGIYTFLFASLAFAYFYLRSSNSGQLWRPGGVTAPTGLGWAIFAIVFASALLTIFGNRRLQGGSPLDWEVAGWTAVLGGLLAIGLQIYQLTQLPFFPGSSGYASCFIGWAVMNIMLLFSGVYWLETNLAASIRTRRSRAEEKADGSALSPATQLFRANIEACTYFWGFMAVVSLLFWVFFYLI